MFSSNTTQVSNAANYIEDVFSTYLYTGNGSTQTITNGIDLSGKGGLVWTKSRGGGASNDHILKDTVRGGANWIYSNNTLEQQTGDTGFSFGSTGFTLSSSSLQNQSTINHASWTFREQPKFFDVVTWTGTGSFPRVISHLLGSTPGCIIIKKTSAADNWYVWHRSLTAGYVLQLDTTGAEADGGGYMTSVTSTTFSPAYNDNGATYVAYVFAHNAGGFGLTGTDNVISCGSFTTDGSGNATVNLGYEPQWWLEKNSSSGGDNWNLLDIARGQSNSSPTAYLFPNLSNAEASVGAATAIPTATGLNIRSHSATTTYIYIAIRRGPMKVPTSGTSVFSPNASSASTGTTLTTGFPVDLSISQYRLSDPPLWSDRLRGMNSTTGAVSTPYLNSSGTGAETPTTITRGWDNTAIQMPSYYGGLSTIFWNFRRAPSFFDEVCYTGTGSAMTVTHNLGVVPEMMIVKQRSAARDWMVYSSTTGAGNYLQLNWNDAAYAGTIWNSTAPTSSVFSVSSSILVNASGGTYVAYLFATCAGVSKVGSYTGNGSTQTINCGFTGGARFVLIKRTDSTGDWYVYDTARGMTTLTDPYLLLNSTAAESATLGSVTTVSTGFAVNASILAAINTNGASYIFLAIA